MLETPPYILTDNHHIVQQHYIFLTQLTLLRFSFGVNMLLRSKCSDTLKYGGTAQLWRSAAVRSRAVLGRCGAGGGEEDTCSSSDQEADGPHGSRSQRRKPVS